MQRCLKKASTAVVEEMEGEAWAMSTQPPHRAKLDHRSSNRAGDFVVSVVPLVYIRLVANTRDRSLAHVSPPKFSQRSPTFSGAEFRAQYYCSPFASRGELGENGAVACRLQQVV